MSNKAVEKVMAKAAKRALKPKLRFPEFRDAGEWETKELSRLIKIVSPPKKIPSTRYLDSGSVPIIDQSQAKISGWTNDQDAVISHGLPLIIFGDHTCILKITDAPFAQGADGIKIFGASSGVRTNYLYRYLESNPVRMEEYKRHFSTLRIKTIVYPDEKTGEQQKIADCLSSLDDLITAQGQKIDTLKTHKKGLMQQLFPAEGETLPKLRFPEFQDAGEWEERQMGDVAPLQRGFDLPSHEVKPGRIPVVFSNGIQKFHNMGMEKGPGLVTGRSGTIGKIHFIEEGDYWPHNTSLWVTSFKGNFPKFIYYLYKSIGTKRFASGSGVPTLNRNDVHAFQARLPPSVQEQQKIADCLSSLDDLITAQGQKLEELKTHKKGLMQQLFPSADEVNG